MSPASGDLGLSCVYLSGNWLGLVSIQLMSPASGDVLTSRYQLCPRLSLGVSIQLMSPASGKDEQFYGISIQYHDVSIQLMSPASGDVICS